MNASLEQRIGERTVELRQSIAELEAVSYSISHDMRAPLRAMQQYAEILSELRDDQFGPQAREFLRRIMSSASRLDSLILDVLQYSQLARETIQLQPLELEPLVRNILNDYPTLNRAKAHIHIIKPLLNILGHEAFVAQALSNLLTNAVKFVGPKTIPQVRLWTEPVEREEMGRLEKFIRIWVQDNGVGIALEHQRRIFRIFERVYPNDRYEGTGIGLAIVLKAVTRMGGRIGVESVLGGGSKFWIELKAA